MNDNMDIDGYEIRQGFSQTRSGEKRREQMHWSVFLWGRRVSLYFLTIEQAHRCLQVLREDDAYRAAKRRTAQAGSEPSLAPQDSWYQTDQSPHEEANPAGD